MADSSSRRRADAACPTVRCLDEESCAITCAMDAIGNKWHPVIVDRLREGPLRFSDLAAALGGVTNKVLSESLSDLEAKGLVDRRVIDDKPVEVEYALTERGASLAPVIDALRVWGETHRAPTDGEGPADRD